MIRKQEVSDGRQTGFYSSPADLILLHTECRLGAKRISGISASAGATIVEGVAAVAEGT
jgi:hypothetical protein